MHGVATLNNSFLCCLIRKFGIYFHTFLCMTFHITGPCRRCLHHVSLKRVVFLVLLRRYWIQTYFWNCRQHLCSFRTLVECNPNKHGQGMMLVLPNRLLCWVLFHIGSRFCFFLANFMSSTYTDKNNPFSRCTKRHSQFGIFSQPCFNRIFSNCLSHDSPTKRWPYRFLSRGTTGSSILDHDLVHLCRGRRIQMSQHFDFRIFNSLGASSILTLVLADTASAACPSQPGNLEMKNMTLAAVICDADDPFSVNIAYDPESSSTISPRSTTRPLYLWHWGTNSEFFRWQRSINDAKWTFLPYSLLPSSINSFLFMTYDSCHAGIFSNFPMLFSLHPQHLIFFNAWGIGRNLCTKF